MMFVSYRHPQLGDASIRVYDWEVGVILADIFSLALQGHEFSNLTVIKKTL